MRKTDYFTKFWKKFEKFRIEKLSNLPEILLKCWAEKPTKIQVKLNIFYRNDGSFLYFENSIQRNIFTIFSFTFFELLLSISILSQKIFDFYMEKNLPEIFKLAFLSMSTKLSKTQLFEVRKQTLWNLPKFELIRRSNRFDVEIIRQIIYILTNLIYKQNRTNLTKYQLE